jgi:hypothetical protein
MPTRHAKRLRLIDEAIVAIRPFGQASKALEALQELRQDLVDEYDADHPRKRVDHVGTPPDPDRKADKESDKEKDADKGK